MFLAIAVDNLANAQELTKVSLALWESDGFLVPLEGGGRPLALGALGKSALQDRNLPGWPLLEASGHLESDLFI